jgi:hypothetical protein
MSNIGQSRHHCRTATVFMRRETRSRQDRYKLEARLAAVAAGLVAFACTWLLLAPAAIKLTQPTAVVRQRHRSDPAEVLPPEQAIAALLSAQHLGEAIHEANFMADADLPVGSAEWVEYVRENVRIDLGVPDEAGMQTTVLRWTGRLPNAGAARLLNVLARRLAMQPATSDGGLREAQHRSAQQAVQAARHAVDDTRRQLDAALTAQRDHSVIIEDAVARSKPVEQPRQASAIAPEQDDRFLLQQRLLDLETRRQALAERLMPEHPEMKAIDQKIAAMRMGLTNRPPAPSEPLPDVAMNTIEPPAALPEQGVLADRVRQLSQALLAAQEAYTSACDRERTCWRALEAMRATPLAEIEPARMDTPTKATGVAWRRWLVSLTTALTCGGSVLALWPRRRANFTTVEEVRAATRLPVIVVSRGSLN